MYLVKFLSRFMVCGLEPISTGAALLGSAGIQAGSALLGSFINKKTDNSEAIMRREYERQKEFAQNQIQWRAKDAEKAGLSKFAAIGGNSYYTPSYSGSSSGFSMGDAVASAGEAISRNLSMYAMMSQKEALDGQRLENEQKRLDLLEQISNIKADPKNIGHTTGYSQGPDGLMKMPTQEYLEQFENSIFGTQFRLQALEDAMSKDKFGALKDFRSIFSNNPAVVDAFQSRRWNGLIKSVPVFDLGKLSREQRIKLGNAIIDKTPLLNSAVNQLSESAVRKMFADGDSERINSYLQDVGKAYDWKKKTGQSRPFGMWLYDKFH